MSVNRVYESAIAIFGMHRFLLIVLIYLCNIKYILSNLTRLTSFEHTTKGRGQQKYAKSLFYISYYNKV